jgi:PAS domain S-box-containing protein
MSELEKNNGHLEHALLERALHASNNGILITDAGQTDNAIIWCNPGFTRLTGYTFADIVGRNCRFLQGRDTDPETRRHLQEAIAAGKAIRVNILNYRKNGEPFWNDLDVAPVVDASGRLTHFIGVQSEIIDRRPRNEQEAEAAHRYAETIADTVREPLLILNANLEIETANLSFYRMFATSHAETVRQPIFALGNGQWNIPALRRLLEEILPAQKMIHDFEVTHDFPTIGSKTMLLNARTVGPDDGFPARILLAIEDITHRTDMLRASVEFARGVVDSLSAHVAILDERGLIVAVNRAWERFAQANGVDVTNTRTGINLNYLDMCESATGECSEDAITMSRGMRAVLNGDLETFEHEYPCHAPFEQRWFVGRVTRFMYAGRRYLVVAHENVTTRWLSQEALHQTEERYRLLVENARDYAVMTLDLEGRITDWSQGAAAIFGFRADEMLGRHVSLLFTPEDQARGVPEHEMRRVQNGEKAFDVRWHVRRDGSRFWADGELVALYDRNGKHQGYGKLLRDRTVQKQAAEEHERHLNQIESLNMRLQRSMTETHHRVGNNLQIIAAMIDLQRMDAHEMVPVSVLGRLGAQIKALAAVHQVLTLTLREQENAQRVSAAGVLEKIVGLLDQMGDGYHQLTFATEDAQITARQATALALCVQELYSNALKHGKGEVGVCFTVLDSTARLEVTDNGPGFPSGFSAEQAANTGLDLVLNLARTDLGGQVHFGNTANGEGQVWIEFPLPK